MHMPEVADSAWEHLVCHCLCLKMGLAEATDIAESIHMLAYACIADRQMMNEDHLLLGLACHSRARGYGLLIAGGLLLIILTAKPFALGLACRWMAVCIRVRLQVKEGISITPSCHRHTRSLALNVGMLQKGKFA